MNEVLKALKERRSIRSYTTEPVSAEDLNQILEAATFAPTARNTQAWHITVLRGAEVISRLDKALKEASVKPGFDKYREFVSSPSYTINYGKAQVFIIVGADPKVSPCPVEDGSLVLGQILLAAHSLGLGACWINQLGAVSEEAGFRKVLASLGFPDGYQLVGSVALGHREGSNPKAPPRKTGQINIV